MRVTNGRVLTSATSREERIDATFRSSCRLPRDTLDIHDPRSTSDIMEEKKNARPIIKNFYLNDSGFVNNKML